MDFYVHLKWHFYKFIVSCISHSVCQRVKKIYENENHGSIQENACAIEIE